MRCWNCHKQAGGRKEAPMYFRGIPFCDADCVNEYQEWLNKLMREANYNTPRKKLERDNEDS